VRDDVVAALYESFRVTFKAEYSKLQRLEFVLPDNSFKFSTEPAERFSMSAGIGRFLGGGEILEITRTRLDAKLSYEDFTDDPDCQDHDLATLTLTLPVSEGLFVVEATWRKS
jgi:hypothetical protein